ncbi:MULTISPECIES: Crp/Fnr family transcriptional regulator [Thiomicrorhabdus]|uniref:Cyclic nucleotide-binding domain-containing protein n=1 Tax=Thiomicrorhabdus heinhorstiae TaxID=2748010 RepID=A0ABS0BYC5_9GAMM|nr:MULTISPECIES: cyclic nucleotide-binding domain-containing protein [Thiomicrorhabdus]MBF6056956.1 cyclic nucleotide-binding domain-containing protein [Thiomicrorhabdus heinhorstiae]
MISLSVPELFTFFQEHSVCESLTKAEVERLIPYLQEKTYKGREIVFERGEVTDNLSLITEGKVDFIGHAEDAGAVGEQHVGTLVGEMSFFDRKPRNLRMIAGHKGAKMIFLTRPMYDRLKVEEPYIAVNILENAIVSLDELVRHMGDDISTLGHYMHGFGKQ